MDERTIAAGAGTRGRAGALPDSSEAPEPGAGRGASPDRRTMQALGLTVLAAVSVLLGAFVFSQPDVYGWIFQSLDAKRDGVLGLAGACVGASTAISALPGDIGTPLANQVAGLGKDLLVVLAAIYLEKFLLTTIGGFSFAVLFPVGLVLLALAVRFDGNARRVAALRSVAGKCVAFGVAIFLVVPASIVVSDAIESTYQVSLDDSAQKIEQTLDGIGVAGADAGTGGAAAGDSGEGASGAAGGSNLIEDIAAAVAGGAEAVASGADGALSAVGQAVDIALDAVAILIVTSCIIPVLVLFAFLWLANLILGIDVSRPMEAIKPSFAKKGK